MTELILVRHGQTISNQKKLLQGQSNGVLTEEGKKQACVLAYALKEQSIDIILTSPLIRAKDTAVEIAKFHQVEVIENPVLCEWHCGILDGQPAKELAIARDKAGLPLADFRPDGGETLREVQARARQFLDEINTKYSGLRVLVCSHGDFLRMLISLLQNISIEEANEIYLENAAFSTFIRDENSWVNLDMNLH